MKGQLAGYFKSNYPDALRGVAWVNNLPEHERKAFAAYGLAQAEYGHKGGVVRAMTAQRDGRGRFATNGGR